MTADERTRNGFTIRALAAHDVENLVGLLGELGYPTGNTEASERIAALSGSPSHALFVAEDREGSVAGFIQVAASRAVVHAPEAEIVSLVVASKSRGAGAGAALVGAADA